MQLVEAMQATDKKKREVTKKVQDIKKELDSSSARLF
jgi:hypothetical protein